MLTNYLSLNIWADFITFGLSQASLFLILGFLLVFEIFESHLKWCFQVLKSVLILDKVLEQSDLFCHISPKPG